MQKISLAIHGGAGTILKEDMTPELEAAYLQGLESALAAGYQILEQGGTAINAVEVAVALMEDNLLFNAGRGAVFTNQGKHEMDASIMNGQDLSAGAVTAISGIKNPVKLAAEIMRKSNHIFLCGQGAMDFAAQQGFTTEPDEFFFSQFRYDQWRQVCNTEEVALDHNIKKNEAVLKDKKFGTVGAAACDTNGNIAAATSTGGMTNKKFGRIGDSPLIGAGTYANNKTCAISCTGHGEIFMQAVAAYDVSCLMEYRGLSLEAAMQEVVHNKLVAMQGEGGMVGVDAHGNMALMFNSAGMYRGAKSSDGISFVGIYGDGE